MVEPQRAAVVPRVLSEASCVPSAIEETLEPYLGRTGAIAILGPAGCGRTTALAHLAAAFPRRIALFDDDTGLATIRDAAAAGLAVYAQGRIHRVPHLATLLLAPWGKDEALEYLMAVHRAACAEVMPRLAADPDLASLGGIAELWCAVLDRMAAGRRSVADALAEIATRAAAGDRIYRHPVIRILRRAHELALEVRGGPGEWPALGIRQEREVIREAARLLLGSAEAVDALSRLWDGPKDERQPMGASLLLALRPEWKPRGAPRLEGAYLRGARWRAGVLREAVLLDADLADADLDAAVLDLADATRASFRGARLRGASFREARLLAADLRDADLAGAVLTRAKLLEADLRGAKLPGADLAEATLLNAKVEGADLSGANLSGTRCWGLDLRTVRLEGANLSAAHLESCHLDGVRLRGARFDHAHLEQAFLTASAMPKACFRDAKLNDAKVAGVDWERADLRGADLTGAIFHMGSSRSGLVESFLASEGTRTGFYTDEFDEQHFKAPEEIRKANLRGADLRGAKVEGTDFYLVDLREAVYDDAQAVHFRRCRAILKSKAM
jgi:uncharacterized protein YjbI with pentapeptide repeats